MRAGFIFTTCVLAVSHDRDGYDVATCTPMLAVTALSLRPLSDSIITYRIFRDGSLEWKVAGVLHVCTEIDACLNTHHRCLLHDARPLFASDG